MPTPLYITPQGLTSDNQLAIFNQLVASYLAIYPQANLQPQSYDGQIVGTQSLTINNVTQAVMYNYAALNVFSATGYALDIQANNVGVIRRIGSNSTVILTFTGTIGANIPLGFLVASNVNFNIQYATTAIGVIGSSGTVEILATCTTGGAVLTPPNELTVFVTPPSFLSSVTNIAQSIIGVGTETDNALLSRRQRSLLAPTTSPYLAMAAGLLNTSGVTDAVVLENYTNIVDANGTSAHGVQAVVLGGETSDIATTISIYKSLGCSLTGSISTYVNRQLISFNRPSTQQVFFSVQLSPNPAYPPNVADQTKAAIINYLSQYQKIGQSLFAQDVANAITSSVVQTRVVYVYQSTSVSPTNSDTLTPSQTGIFTSIVANISVLV